MEPLSSVFNKIISFLNKEHYDYLLIGGMAVSVLGSPRMTQDIDFCIFLNKNSIKKFLTKAKKKGFVFCEKEITERIKETGTFKIQHGSYHIDFILASTEFEKEALERKQKLKVYGIDAYFPTSEDLILFKIVPARHIDMADIEGLIERNARRLDVKYLMKWGMKLSDEAHDMRIYKELKRLLAEV